MDWDKLKYFYHVAKAGNFSQAAEELQMNQSSLSRSIMKLESDLNAKLFNRGKFGVTLTRQGEILLDHTIRMIGEAESALTLMRDEEEKPKGLLRVATTASLAATWLTQYLPNFLKKYPDIRLTIIGSDQELDLLARESDVIIRPWMPHRPDLVQWYLTTFHLKLYASQEYIEKFGLPKKPEDLDNHRLISFGWSTKAPYENINWPLYVGAKKVREPYMEINSAYGLHRSVAEGLGIAAISEEYHDQEQLGLINVLPEVKGPSIDIYYVFPKQLESSRRIVVLGDYLREVLKSDERYAKEKGLLKGTSKF